MLPSKLQFFNSKEDLNNELKKLDSTFKNNLSTDRTEVFISVDHHALIIVNKTKLEIEYFNL